MKLLRFLVLLICSLLFAPWGRPTTMIYPVEAIDDLWSLPADEFRQRYSGINISGLGPSDEGWYVRYRHENLTYLFGPLQEREEARAKKWEMEAVRDAAIRNRQSLASSSVDFVRFTYSGTFGKAGNGAGGGADGERISKDGKSGPDGDLDGDGIPNSMDPDMDGDGIPNDQDPDIDGDGIPNEKDDYMYGTAPGKEGQQGGANGKGDSDGGSLADSSKAGANGDKSEAKGEQGTDSQSGNSGQKSGKVASSQNSRQNGSRGSQSQSGQTAQAGQQSQQGGQPSASGQPGQPGGGPPNPASGSSGPPPSPNIIMMLLRMILGI